MSNEFSELGGECTYLISSSHLSLNFVVLLFEYGECCFDLLVAQESEICVGIFKRIDSVYKILAQKVGK